MAELDATHAPAPPEFCSVALKEWAGVCALLLAGRQSLLLRKGGVVEPRGAGGFEPVHPAFWLFPTRVHEPEQGLRPGWAGEPIAAPGPGLIELPGLAVVATARWIGEEATLERLRPFHGWSDETARSRFHYRTPGIWALVVRAWRASRAPAIPDLPAYAGCTSWVPLEQDLRADGLEPAMAEADWLTSRERILSAIDTAGGTAPCP